MTKATKENKPCFVLTHLTACAAVVKDANANAAAVKKDAKSAAMTAAAAAVKEVPNAASYTKKR